MTDDTAEMNSPPHRRTFEASGDDVEVRQPEDTEDGVFELRLPIASTGEVRNQGDDPLTRDEIDAMARQIGDGVVSVFPDHGESALSPSRYSIVEKGGEWREAEITTRDEGDAALLEATARLMDPDTLPDIPIREMLGTVKELVNRDMSIPASIGWRDDEGAPGGVDLMEASLVGIPADPRTKSGASASEVVARAAVDAGADPDALVARVKAATRNLDDPEFSEGDAVEWESGATVRGRVADIGPEFKPSEELEDPITGEDGEAVYLIHELDDELEPPQYRRENVAKPESSLNESQADLPPLEGNFADEDSNSMTEQDTSEESDTTEEQRAEMGETMNRLVDLQEEQTEMLREMMQAMDGEDEEDDDEEEEDDEQSADTEDTDTQDTDETDGEQSADVDEDLRDEISTLREQLDEVREGGVSDEDVDVPSDDESEERDSEQTTDHAEDGAKSLLR